MQSYAVFNYSLLLYLGGMSQSPLIALSMSVLNKIASALNLRDDKPNIDLASEIAALNNSEAVKELVENLTHKDKNIQSDCIKVLYEIAERNPALIIDYDTKFIELLSAKNNRMIWGAMAALDSITSFYPKKIYNHLVKIVAAIDTGSVITKDRGINILIKLANEKSYSKDALTLLLEQFKTCATKQLPMYAEKSLPVINEAYKKDFIKVFVSRLPQMEQETKRTRVETVIKKLNK